MPPTLLSALDRRAFLSIGSLGLLGALSAAEVRPRRSAVKSIIFLHQFGGPSQIDTFDMKPDAPAEIRGIYRPMPSRLPGVPVCSALPDMANVMDKVCLIRSMHHEMKNHNSAGYYSLTGQAPAIDDIRLRDTRDLHPAYGSVIDRFAPATAGTASFVSYPHVLNDGSNTPGQHASFLGPQHDPFFIGQDPNTPDFRLPELSLPANLNPRRLEDRRDVQRLIDASADLIETSPRARGLDTYYERALALLTSPRFRNAFDLSKTPANVRDRYGRTTYGQGCLLARQLVEAGVKFVTVYFAATIGGQSNRGGWDTHGFNNNPMYPVLNDYLLPITNQSLPTLLNDLDERGLLNDTLVVWAGEFGRTPRINNIAGRDHWPQCYTVLLAGAGVKRGFVFGSSDTRGAYPSTNAVRPEDLSATLYHLMGIDPHTLVRDPLNRPVPLSTGSVIEGILT